MIERETIPRSFQETTLHIIFKGGSGRRQILSDNRFVHSKPWYHLTVEGLLVVEGLKEPLDGLDWGEGGKHSLKKTGANVSYQRNWVIQKKVNGFGFFFLT